MTLHLNKHKLALFLRLMSLVICLTVAISGRPPAHSQTSYDALQDERALDAKSRSTDMAAAIQRQWQAQNTLQQTVSGMQGENRVIFAVLGLLQSGSIVVGLKPKKGQTP